MRGPQGLRLEQFLSAPSRPRIGVEDSIEIALSNRQVRIRSACGLSRLKNYLEDIICLALKTQDTYAIQELVSELERSGGIFELVTALGIRAAVPEPRPLCSPRSAEAVAASCWTWC